MDIQSEKLELIEWIAGLDDRKVIRHIKAVKKETGADNFWKSSTYDLLARAKTSLLDVQSGKTTKLKDFKKEVNLWKRTRSMK